LVLTTETLEGVATPVVVVEPPLEEEPPLQPASSNAMAIRPVPSFTVEDDLIGFFMWSSFVNYLSSSKCFSAWIKLVTEFFWY